MAITHGFEILVASSVTADKKAEITEAVIGVLRHRTLSFTTLTTTYVAGSTSVNQVGIEVGGASEDFGIRVIMDSAVVSNKEVLRILAALIKVLEAETIVPVFAATYTAGDRTYNMVITVT